MSMSSWGPENLAQLLEQKSFTGVLQWLCNTSEAAHRKNPKVYSYSELAQKMGYKSRSYVREVADNKCKPNISLVNRFCAFTKANTTWKLFFESLYKVETEGDPKGSIAHEILILKNKLQKQLVVKHINAENQEVDFFLDDPEVPVVFAALGSTSKGASLEEIVKRTNLKSTKVRSILEKLVSKNAISQKNNRFYASDVHVLLERFGNADVFLSDVQASLKKLQSLSQEKLIQDQEVVYLSSFSVSEKNMPQLKKEITNLLTNFVNDNEYDEGDKVVNLATFLTFNR